MRLTVYTDYTLRVMMFLAARHRAGALSRIDEIAAAYHISRSHLTKIVHELGQSGLVETVRGRSGGMRLSKAPSEIKVGDIVRLAEKDFAVVACHDAHSTDICTIQPACTLKRALWRAMEAFMRELDALTLEEAITTPAEAAALLGIPAEAPVALPTKGSGKRLKPAD